MTCKKIIECLYLATAFVGAIIVASNINQAQLGYAVLFVSSVAAIYLLRLSNASRSLIIVNALFLGINAYGIIRG